MSYHHLTLNLSHQQAHFYICCVLQYYKNDTKQHRGDATVYETEFQSVDANMRNSSEMLTTQWHHVI